MQPKLKVLFLCTGNSCRSPMAEGWARALIGDRIEPFSAGTAPGPLDRRAVQVMGEAGVDISGQRSKHVRDFSGTTFDWVVTVCDRANESCPVFPGGARRLHVGFDDPPRLAEGAASEEEALRPYRRVRDEIRAFVERLPNSLERPEARRLGIFERYLTIWVAVCMLVGVLLGKLLPAATDALRRVDSGEGSRINVPIAILIWLMIYPMMLKIDFGSLLGVGRRPGGLLVTLFVNWLIKPFSMAFLGWPFFKHLFLPLIGPELADQYVAGVIILAAAPGALIGASNFFELAVAVAITLFRPESGAALATVVGVLVEVPVMLSVCSFCNRTRHWFDASVPSPSLPVER